MLKVTHNACSEVGFYVHAIPVGRGFIPMDALTEYGLQGYAGNIVECQSCGKKINLKEINDYYELPSEE